MYTHTQSLVAGHIHRKWWKIKFLQTLIRQLDIFNLVYTSHKLGKVLVYYFASLSLNRHSIFFYVCYYSKWRFKYVTFFLLCVTIYNNYTNDECPTRTKLGDIVTHKLFQVIQKLFLDSLKILYSMFGIQSNLITSTEVCDSNDGAITKIFYKSCTKMITLDTKLKTSLKWIS